MLAVYHVSSAKLTNETVVCQCYMLVGTEECKLSSAVQQMRCCTAECHHWVYTANEHGDMHCTALERGTGICDVQLKVVGAQFQSRILQNTTGMKRSHTALELCWPQHTWYYPNFAAHDAVAPAIQANCFSNTLCVSCLLMHLRKI